MKPVDSQTEQHVAIRTPGVYCSSVGIGGSGRKYLCRAARKQSSYIALASEPHGRSSDWASGEALDAEFTSYGRVLDEICRVVSRSAITSDLLAMPARSSRDGGAVILITELVED